MSFFEQKHFKNIAQKKYCGTGHPLGFADLNENKLIPEKI